VKFIARKLGVLVREIIVEKKKMAVVDRKAERRRDAFGIFRGICL
jgi:hypothetical protein